MMKVISYGNRKSDQILWDASTPELEAAAHLALFRYLKEYGVYEASPPNKKEKPFFEKALNGDAHAAGLLLSLRKQYEYEEWDLLSVKTP